MRTNRSLWGTIVVMMVVCMAVAPNQLGASVQAGCIQIELDNQSDCPLDVCIPRPSGTVCYTVNPHTYVINPYPPDGTGVGVVNAQDQLVLVLPGQCKTIKTKSGCCVRVCYTENPCRITVTQVSPPCD